jgi:hypothetical protein
LYLIKYQYSLPYKLSSEEYIGQERGQTSKRTN